MCRRYSPDHEDYWMLLLLHIHRNVPTRQQHSVASWMSTLHAATMTAKQQTIAVTEVTA